MLDTVTPTNRWLDQREQNVPRGIVTAHPLVLARGQGSLVWDVEGREYLDFVGGIGVLNVGHNHPRVVEAVQRQLTQLPRSRSPATRPISSWQRGSTGWSAATRATNRCS